MPTEGLISGFAFRYGSRTPATIPANRSDRQSPWFSRANATFIRLAVRIAWKLENAVAACSDPKDA
jgi:hypothetical protein